MWGQDDPTTWSVGRRCVGRGQVVGTSCPDEEPAFYSCPNPSSDAVASWERGHSCLPRPPALSFREIQPAAIHPRPRTPPPLSPPRALLPPTGNRERRTRNVFCTSHRPPLRAPCSVRMGEPLQGSILGRSTPGVPSFLGHAPAIDGRTPLGFGFPCSVAALTTRIMTAHHSAIPPQRGTGNREPGTTLTAPQITTHRFAKLNGEPGTPSLLSTPRAKWRTHPGFSFLCGGAALFSPLYLSPLHKSPPTASPNPTGNREPGTTLPAPRRSERSARRKASGVRWQRRPGASSTPL